MKRPAAAAGVRMVAAILLSGLFLAACGATREKAAGPALRSLDAPAPAADPAAVGLLADTRWRLVEIQSMDDSVGTARPEDPSRCGTVVVLVFVPPGIGTKLALTE